MADKATDTRKQRFFGAAMLPTNELECTGIMHKLAALDKKFMVREMKKAA